MFKVSGGFHTWIEAEGSGEVEDEYARIGEVTGFITGSASESSVSEFSFSLESLFFVFVLPGSEAEF